MKLTLLGGESNCAGKHCPSIFLGDDGQYYIKGYLVGKEAKSEAAVGPDEGVLRINPELVRIIKEL